MFKKLKEKITEEVKISPQRFAEFTQSVSDRLQTSTTSDENFFSIGDDDANNSASAMSSSNNHGFSSVTLVSPSQETRNRKSSSSSIASDVSFLPRYEAGSMYHLQSDLDVSASELEDNVSTTSSTIGHLSKEQIYSAFQKSQMRYHKYRGRFTDLSRHYKDLERENAKMKSVLVDTQDKAIRRVTELKEQCNLEQKAKAHLESALRDELDEKKYKIKALQTKIELLGNGAASNHLIDINSQENNSQENLENLTKYLNDARKEIESLNAKLQETKANAIIFQSKEQEYKSKLSNLEKEIAQFSVREKENNLKIAETKMELHNELSSKDAEIDNLKRENEALKQSLDTFENERKTSTNVKMENLQSQNHKLIERMENLSLKCNHLERELIRSEGFRMEIRDLKETEEDLEKEIARLRIHEETARKLSEENCRLTENLTEERKDFESQIDSLREDAKKGLLSLEPKIREKVRDEYSLREDELRREFNSKIDELSSSKDSVAQVQLQLLLKDDMLKEITAELDAVKSELSQKLEEYNDLERNHLELIEDCTRLRGSVSDLERDKTSPDAHEEKASRLEAHIGTLQKELEDLEEKLKQKESGNVALCRENFDLQQTLRQTGEKLRILEVKDEAIELDSSESKLLELKLQQLEEEQTSMLSEFETERKMFNDLLGDHRDLQKRELEIEALRRDLEACHEEMKRLKTNLEAELERNVRINDEKLFFERLVSKLSERVRIFEEKDEAACLDRSERGLLGLRLQNAEQENRRMSETFELERALLAAEAGAESDERYSKHKVNDARRLSDAKEKGNVDLAKEILTLQQQNSSLSEHARLLEEKLEAMEMNSTESKLLEIKVHKLEEDREKLLIEIDTERKMFEELLENHKELQEKQALIAQLEDTISNDRVKFAELETSLSDEKKANVQLAEDKLLLEKRIAKLEEQKRISEEREEAIELDKSECGILELKLQKLENENRTLLETFELERLAFKKTGEESVKNSRKVAELQEENSRLRNLVEVGKKEVEQLKEEIKHHKEKHKEGVSKIAELLARIEAMEEETQALHLTLRKSDAKSKADIDELNSITSENSKLKREVEDKEKQVLELSRNVKNLSEVIEKQTVEFGNLLQRTQQLDAVLEKMRAESSEVVRKEKQQQVELTLKIEQLQQEVAGKAAELKHLNRQISELEKLYAEERRNNQEMAGVVETLRGQVVELMESCQNDLEKGVLEDKLKAAESDLKDRITRLKIKEQENYILQEERDSLVAEIDSLRTNLRELSEENGDLKAQLGSKSSSNAKLNQLEQENEQLKAAAAKSHEEMSQLTVRLQQISSDNRTVVEESQNVMHDNEELKIKLEYLESEKGEFDTAKAKLEEEVSSLTGALGEMKRQLELVRQQNVQMTEEHSLGANGPDVAKIQRDFFEIKRTCDDLFVENGNLKAEYSKLEERCDGFAKIKQKLEAQIAELEGQYSELQHEKQLLQDEVQELKTSPLNQTTPSRLDQLDILKNEHAVADVDASKELEMLRDKLTKYKSLDLTNKSSIEFYEHELQKMKNQNEKLNRKLDETLVTLNHCAALSPSTEVEYLRNVLYNYMLGKESLVLARVIAAVCKFDAHQTETILQKEQQKQTLLGHLGLI